MSTVFEEDRFKVIITGNDHTDPLSQVGRITVFDKSSRRVLMRDGTWASVPEGSVLPENAGYAFPLGAVGQLGQAIEQYLGGATHTRTEVAVLREWLAHEIAQRLVADRVIREASLPPRITDFAPRGVPVPERTIPTPGR